MIFGLDASSLGSVADQTPRIHVIHRYSPFTYISHHMVQKSRSRRAGTFAQPASISGRYGNFIIWLLILVLPASQPGMVGIIGNTNRRRAHRCCLIKLNAPLTKYSNRRAQPWTDLQGNIMHHSICPARCFARCTNFHGCWRCCQAGNPLERAQGPQMKGCKPLPGCVVCFGASVWLARRSQKWFEASMPASFLVWWQTGKAIFFSDLVK